MPKTTVVFTTHCNVQQALFNHTQGLEDWARGNIPTCRATFYEVLRLMHSSSGRIMTHWDLNFQSNSGLSSSACSLAPWATCSLQTTNRCLHDLLKVFFNGPRKAAHGLDWYSSNLLVLLETAYFNLRLQLHIS